MKKIVLFPVVFCAMILGACKDEPDKKIVLWDVAAKDSLSYLDDIYLCTELMPDEAFVDDASKIDTVLFRDGSIHQDSLIQYVGEQEDKVDAAVENRFRWKFTHLKVRFLDGDTTVIRRVINAAKEWERHCSIRFLFGVYPDADISISFAQSGSWSYIGSYSKQMKPSMNFGWLHAGIAESELRRVVLHEFGHAIGLIHEHQHPGAAINWDSAKVYQYYERPPNRWSRPRVDHNIFRKYNVAQVNATEFDSLSIMLYAIPRSLTKDGFSTRNNTGLSTKDIEFIGTIYP